MLKVILSGSFGSIYKYINLQIGHHLTVNLVS